MTNRLNRNGNIATKGILDAKRLGEDVVHQQILVSRQVGCGRQEVQVMTHERRRKQEVSLARDKVTLLSVGWNDYCLVPPSAAFASTQERVRPQ